MGIRSTTLDPSNLIDELIGNRAGGTVKISLTNLGLLLSSGGSLASADRVAELEGLLGDLVLDLGPIHPTVAAGLAATSAGQQFRVASADADVSYSVYLHAAGATGTLIAEVPAPAVLSSIMGAVTGKVNAADVGGFVTTALDWAAGSYYNNATGTLTNYGSFCSAVVAAQPGDVFRVSGTLRASPQVSLLVFLDAGGAVISKHLTGTGSPNTLTFLDQQIEAPAGAVSAAFSTLARYAGTVEVMISKIISGTSVEARAALIEARVDSLSGASSRWEPVPRFWSANGAYLRASDGAFVSGYTSWETGALAVSPGETYRVTTSTDGGLTAAWAVVNSDGALLDVENTGIVTGTTKYFVESIVKIPPGGAELRVSSRIHSDYGMSRVERLTSAEQGWRSYDLDYAAAQEAYINRSTGAVTAYDDPVDLKWYTWRVGVVPGDTWRMSCGMTGTVTASVAFYTASGAFMASMYAPLVNDAVYYVDEEFVVPAGAALMAFCVRRDLSRGVEKLERLVSDASATRTAVERIDRQLNAAVKSSAYGPAIISHWSGRSVLWLGTSIPMGSGTNQYPSKVGEILGATVTNKALSSSMVRVGVPESVSANDPLGWTRQGFSNWNSALLRSLAMTTAEKQSIIDNWSTKWGALIGGAAPTSAILDYSYEARLTPYLDRDVIIFDHGHNDSSASVGGHDDGDLLVIPGVDVTVDALGNSVGTRDRRWFIGAMNYLIDVILSNNPKARIVLVGHYENDRKTKISLAQEYLADLWSIPLIRLWEDSGWSQQVVASGASAGKTLTKVWMPDDLHPHSDTSGAATTHLAEIISRRLKDIW